MGRWSPGMAGGVVLISWMSSARARAMRGARGCSRWTVIAGGDEGDGAGQAADDALAGGGAVFVVVAEVGVELVR
jgi:hypothetical protein